MGKLKAKNPQLFVYYICHRDHVTIIIQSSSQALSIISTCYTLIKLDLAKHMLQSLPLDSPPHWISTCTDLCQHLACLYYAIPAEECLLMRMNYPSLAHTVFIVISTKCWIQTMHRLRVKLRLGLG